MRLTAAFYIAQFVRLLTRSDRLTLWVYKQGKFLQDDWDRWRHRHTLIVGNGHVERFNDVCPSLRRMMKERETTGNL